ncbi:MULTISPECIES: IS630 family transposase [spotted fever group]|uniref:IS630 family transposase n=1 Tax=spotted fever group TaxID=114277 RepID=UPI0001A60802|nr:IS630 family transposase [Rickettsia endosymbiont of Ixodes scapularis]EER21259.1 transposase [Rickettsia endosymbiont of Ixodes scapularis]EER22632.1 transposase [Rickettsia endosymbiont of Ixodes scapularis]
MPSPYSYDLRKGVIQYIESGKRIIEASQVFNISRKVIYDWKKLKKETGDVQLKTGYQKGHSHKITDMEGFKKFLESNKDKSSRELAILYPSKVSARTIINMIRKVGYSYKKTFLHPKRNHKLRNEFIEKITTIDKDKLVFLDESGIEDNACREHGWSPKGERCYGEKVYQHKHRISMIAGLFNSNIVAPLIFEGNCNKAIFETYVKDILIKELRAGQVVVMDNINFHKNSKVKELIESVGASILFLPTYSPDLNPIEHYWFKIKHQILTT